MDLPCASEVQIPGLDSSSVACVKLEEIPDFRQLDTNALLQVSTILGDNLREIKVTCLYWGFLVISFFQ